MEKELRRKKRSKANPRCKNCESKLIYYRIKDNSRVCRNCGFIEKLEEKK